MFGGLRVALRTDQVIVCALRLGTSTCSERFVPVSARLLESLKISVPDAEVPEQTRIDLDRFPPGEVVFVNALSRGAGDKIEDVDVGLGTADVSSHGRPAREPPVQGFEPAPSVGAGTFEHDDHP